LIRVKGTRTTAAVNNKETRLNMKIAHTQKGLSMIGWITVLALAAFIASAVMKMLPHYMDYMSMSKIISEAGTTGTGEINTVGQFYSHITKGMQVNTIRDLDLKEAVLIEQDGNEFRVQLNYERREPLIQNLDLVARFEKDFVVRMP
jgi:hypothetical protein